MKRYDYERTADHGYRVFDHKRGLNPGQALAHCVRQDFAELITNALNAMDTRDESIRLHDRTIQDAGAGQPAARQEKDPAIG